MNQITGNFKFPDNQFQNQLLKHLNLCNSHILPVSVYLTKTPNEHKFKLNTAFYKSKKFGSPEE